MLSARQLVGVIRLTDKSSTAIRSRALTAQRLCWWAPSLRRQRALVAARHDTPASGALGRPFLLCAEAASRLRQRLLLAPEEVRVGELPPIAQGGERL
jgi:hypothetical protein